jgi:hypothetical protein
MLIREHQYVERECCQPQDLQPSLIAPRIDDKPLFLWCRYCGRSHVAQAIADEIPDGIDLTVAVPEDTTYRPLKYPWDDSLATVTATTVAAAPSKLKGLKLG